MSEKEIFSSLSNFQRDPDIPIEIQLGMDFRKLQSLPEWKSLAHLIAELRRTWTWKMLRFESKDLNSIALERVMLASQVAGLDMLMKDMNAYVEGLKQVEEREKEKRNTLK